MSKIRRKVTVENTKTISESTSRRPSVFERLGPSTGSTAETQCRNWLKTGSCLYGNTCRFIHGPSPRGKGYSSNYRRSPERPTGDLRERMKNKRQDVDTESQKRNTEESSSPVRKESSRGRHRDKEDIKIVKERTPESEEEHVEWETNRDDSDNGDINYDYVHELSLEMKRQKIQRELMKLEQENMDKREEIIIQKEVSPEVVRSKLSPSPSLRKSSKSPKRKSSPKASSAGKKERKAAVVASPLLDQQRTSKSNQSKKKGPRTPSPPPPILEDIILGKKYKEKYKVKDRIEEKPRDGKDRGRDFERQREKRDKPRSSSPGQHHSPLSSRHHSSSSQSGSSIQRHSPSPRRKRTPSPSYQRTLTPSLRRSASPYPTHCLSSPQRKQSPPRHRSPMREKGRHDHERTSQSHDRRHERREGMLCV
ncbi:Zinc finger CCCH domain-containing protein 13 [Lemmus lemmus]